MPEEAKQRLLQLEFPLPDESFLARGTDREPLQKKAKLQLEPAGDDDPFFILFSGHWERDYNCGGADRPTHWNNNLFEGYF